MRQHVRHLVPPIRNQHQLYDFKQKVKQNKLAELYWDLNVTGALDLINLDQFNYTKNIKKKTTTTI